MSELSAAAFTPPEPLPRFLNPDEIRALEIEARDLDAAVRRVLHELQQRLGDRSLEDFNERVRAERKGAIRKELEERLAGPVSRLRAIRNQLADQERHYTPGAVAARASFAAVSENPSAFLAFKALLDGAEGGELVELARYVSQPGVGRLDLALLAQRAAVPHGAGVVDAVRAAVATCPTPPAETALSKSLSGLIAFCDLALVDAESLRGGNVTHRRLEAAFRLGGLSSSPSVPAA